MTNSTLLKVTARTCGDVEFESIDPLSQLKTPPFASTQKPIEDLDLSRNALHKSEVLLMDLRDNLHWPLERIVERTKHSLANLELTLSAMVGPNSDQIENGSFLHSLPANGHPNLHYASELLAACEAIVALNDGRSSQDWEETWRDLTKWRTIESDESKFESELSGKLRTLLNSLKRFITVHYAIKPQDEDQSRE